MDTLLNRLEGFDIDGGAAQLTFAMRLAKEQGWSPDYARRVIREYLRFIYLGTTDGPVTPSHAIDQAWHLHMIYTQSYWDRLCGEVLGKPFHHHPSRGGEREDAKHREQYRATLEKYRQAFGEEPPMDIWGPKPRPVPQPKFRPGWLALLGSVILGTVAVGCEGDPPPGFGIFACLIPLLILTLLGVAWSARKHGTAGGGSGGCSGGDSNLTDSGSDDGGGCGGGCGGGD
jgi:hypothetical protein